jgi:hypothetical protein
MQSLGAAPRLCIFIGIRATSVEDGREDRSLSHGRAPGSSY